MTLIIIAITCAISFYAFSNSNFFNQFKFQPYSMARNGEYPRWIMHGFLHGDITHLLFNMFSLYFAGQIAEQIFGSPTVFVIFYLCAIVVSSIPDYISNKNNAFYSSIGASGAVSATLFSIVLFNPWGTVYIYFLPVPFIIFAVGYILYSFYMSKQNADNIGHMAHLSGAIFGLIATIIYRPDSIQRFFSEILNPRF
ncbi:MAG: rhomboid family intramembrane serine protease [Chitinophagales bacterium]